MYLKFLLNNCLLLILLFLSVDLIAQGSSGSEAKQELNYLIDIPTAGVLEKGNLGVDFDILSKGDLVTSMALSVFRNFSVGISFGANNFIGSGKINFYDAPGIQTKIRIFTETRSFPSFSFGFDSQGKGIFIDSLERYEIKSPGVFFSSSKNFKFLGYLSVHGQLSYSLENNDGDDNLNFGFGIEKTIGSNISFLAEYDFALNDNAQTSIGKGKGYFNLGLRWSTSSGLTLGLDLRNLLDNQESNHIKRNSRAIFMQYITKLY